MSAVVPVLLLLGASLALGSPVTSVKIEWGRITGHSRTTPTLQVVSNPLLNPVTSPVALKAFQALALLDAELVRYVPWFPYPLVGVAELEPPNPVTRTTSWDFKNIIPQLEMVLISTVMRGHKLVPNFSTQPTWMYNTTVWDYPSDPNIAYWSYPRGNEMANTTELLAGYYSRLLSWIITGSLVDEYGNTVSGGPAIPLTHWELFNEPQGCHGADVADYTRQYDAIVARIRRDVDPQHKIKFVGLALQQEDDNIPWIEYFLNSSNHLPGTPLDIISFHFYGLIYDRSSPDYYEVVFQQADTYLETIKNMTIVRDKLSPHTQLSCDETGTILPDDNTPGKPIPPPVYWVASAGYFAYMYIRSAVLGVEIFGQSQFAGCPEIPEWDIQSPQYPSITMVNWTNGEGNARYWLLKLLIDNTQPGDVYVETSFSGNVSSLVHAQAFVSARDQGKKLLLINKKNAPIEVLVPNASGATLHVIDVSTGDGPARVHTMRFPIVRLDNFAIALLEFPD